MRRFGGFDLMRFVVFVFVIVPRTFEWIVRKMYVHNLMEVKEVRREVKWLTEPRSRRQRLFKVFFLLENVYYETLFMQQPPLTNIIININQSINQSIYIYIYI